MLPYALNNEMLCRRSATVLWLILSRSRRVDRQPSTDKGSVQLRWGLRLLAVAVLVLCVAPFILDRETVFWLGEESGPIEQGSVWVWLAAAVWTLGRTLRSRRWLPLAFALVMVLMCVR